MRANLNGWWKRHFKCKEKKVRELETARQLLKCKWIPVCKFIIRHIWTEVASSEDQFQCILKTLDSVVYFLLHSGHPMTYYFSSFLTYTKKYLFYNMNQGTDKIIGILKQSEYNKFMSQICTTHTLKSKRIRIQEEKKPNLIKKIEKKSHCKQHTSKSTFITFQITENIIVFISWLPHVLHMRIYMSISIWMLAAHDFIRHCMRMYIEFACNQVEWWQCACLKAIGVLCYINLNCLIKWRFHVLFLTWISVSST